jgi:hypothetical protein
MGGWSWAACVTAFGKRRDSSGAVGLDLEPGSRCRCSSRQQEHFRATVGMILEIRRKLGAAEPRFEEFLRLPSAK